MGSVNHTPTTLARGWVITKIDQGLYQQSNCRDDNVLVRRNPVDREPNYITQLLQISDNQLKLIFNYLQIGRLDPSWCNIVRILHFVFGEYIAL